MANTNSGYSKEYQDFDPSKDEVIRQWAAKLGLEPDSPYVIASAEVELIRRELLDRMDRLEKKLEESDSAWRSTATTMADGMGRAINLISVQQGNQNSLSENCVNLTSALSDLKPMLQTLQQQASKSPPSPAVSAAGLNNTDKEWIKADIRAIREKFGEAVGIANRLADETIEQAKEIKSVNFRDVKLGKIAGLTLLIWVLAQILLLICVNSAVRPNFSAFSGKLDHVNNNVNTAISQLNKQKVAIDQLQEFR